MAAALVESDRRYFELAATVEDLHGAVVARVPGLERLPAACAVHRLRPERLRSQPDQWVESVTDRLADLGCALARVYLDRPDRPMEAALAAAGYRRRLEVGYLAPGHLSSDTPTQVGLRPVVSEADWSDKAKLHAGADAAADGHGGPAEDWVALERLKCETGLMQAYLVEVDGEVCGAVGTLGTGPLLRIKNLYVDPGRRREGIATDTVRSVSQLAPRRGLAATGMFGVEGTGGDAVYRQLAMAAVTTQIEWSRDLDSRGR